MGLDPFGEIDDEDSDISSGSSPLAQVAERLVTRRIDKEDSWNFDLEVKPG